MNFLQIIDNIDPSASEGYRAINISNQIAKKGHTITLVACESPSINIEAVSKLLDPNIDVLWHRPIIRFHRFYFSPDIYRKIRGHYDLIHLHSYRNHGTIAGSLKGFLTKTPLILSPYGSISYESTLNLKAFYLIQDRLSFNLPIRSASRILAETNYEKETITSYGGSPKRIDVIYRDVDVEVFKRQDPNIFDNPETLLYLGRVTRVKGIELLIKAFSDLPKNVALFIVGTCDDEQYLDGLVSLAKRLNIIERVRFLGGIAHSEVPKYLSSAAVTILPSIFENLGGIIMEAQACESPVVATNVGGISEVMVDGETGFLLKERSHRELSSKLNELLSDENLRREMGRRGRAFILSHFTLTHYMEKILGSYGRAMKK